MYFYQDKRIEKVSKSDSRSSSSEHTMKDVQKIESSDRIGLGMPVEFVVDELGHALNVATGALDLRDFDQVGKVEGLRDAFCGEVEGRDADAGHVLRLDDHLGEETVHEADGGEEDLRGQLEPDLEAAEHVHQAVPVVHRGDALVRLRTWQLQVRLEF